MLNFSILGGSELGKRPWKPGKKLTVTTLLGGIAIVFLGEVGMGLPKEAKAK